MIESEGHVKAGPKFVECGAPSIEGVQDWGDSELLRPYTVDDLIRLVVSASPLLDGIVAAHEPIKHFEDEIIRCAQIMCAYGGCTLILAGEEKKLKQIGTGTESSPETTEQMWRAIVEANLQLPVLYAPGTIAEKHLNLLNPNPDESKLDPVEVVDLGHWRNVEKKVMKVLKERELFAFIGWEPQISWLEAKLGQLKQKELKIWPPEETRWLIPAKSLPYLSFDVIFRRDVLEEPALLNRIDFFLDQLNVKIKKLSGSKNNPASPEVRQIAHYLNMNQRKCADALSDLNFDLLYYPEWVNRKQK